jgi:hypothetical protein
MLGKFIAGDFIAIAGEMRRFPASNENTEDPQKACVYWHQTFLPASEIMYVLKNLCHLLLHQMTM